MTTILCTLYNSLYLDKGLVLYDSLCECAKDFKLYVLCMDDKCYEVLTDLKQEHVIPIKLDEFENGDTKLMDAKHNRTFGEYCWTCTASLIYYILNKYKEPICTYIDADMYFYQDPQILVDEMIKAGKSVMIVPHRFSKANRDLEKNGIYCVEFNTFFNQEDSLDVLVKWRDDCIECCSAENDGIHFGDQKYLDSWPYKYDCVYVCSQLGAGVAPWNILSYKFLIEDNRTRLFSRDTKQEVPLIFYHFQDLTYENSDVVNINLHLTEFFCNQKMIKLHYLNYLSKIQEKRSFLRLEKSLNVLIKSHPAFVAKKYSLYSKLRSFSLGKTLQYIAKKYNKRFEIIKLN